MVSFSGRSALIWDGPESVAAVTTPPKKHVTMWRIAGIAVVLAALAGLAREVAGAWEARRARFEARDAAIDGMLALLKKDPRVRRPETRQLVDEVLRYKDVSGMADARVWHAAGLRAFYGEEDAAIAETAFRRVVALDPKWSWGHNNLGIALFSLGREEEALAEFQRAMDLDPRWSRPHSDLAIMYRRSGRLELAAKEVLAALAIEPEEPTNHYNYAVILDVQQRFDEARTLYERVITMDPTLPAPYYNLACGYAREGDAQKAINYLRRAIAINPAFADEAATDADFAKIRASQEFREITQGPAAP